MKKAISLILAFVLCLSLCACGAVSKTTKMIDAIGNVTLQSIAAIEEAETAYASLDTDQQAKVENYTLLLAARETYDRIKNVTDLIDGIGEVTIESEAAIIAAEEAYNALTKEEQAKIENYTVLTAARDRFLKVRILGEWMDVSIYGMTIVFLEDNTYTYDQYHGEYQATEDGVVFNLGGQDFELEYKKENNVEYLENGLGGEAFAKAEYCTTTVHEITIDNWQDYFTLEANHSVNKDGFGDIESVSTFMGLELLDEYKNRLICTNYNGTDDSYSLAVEIQYTEKSMIVDIAEGSYTLRDSGYSGIVTDVKSIDQTSLYYNCNDPYGNKDIEDVDFCLNDGFSWFNTDGESGTYIYEDIEIIRIQGTLLLYDLPLLNQ